MSFVEELISKAFLSKDAEQTTTKAWLTETEEDQVPVIPTPPVIEIVSPGGRNLGFMLYGRAAPTIKVAATVNGIEHKAVAVKNAGLNINTNNPKSVPNVTVTVSNVNV